MSAVPTFFAVIMAASMLLQTATSADLSGITYAVTVSSHVVGDSSETLCAQISPTAPVSLLVRLNVFSGTVILNETVERDYYRCLSFKVPKVEIDTVATISVAVNGSSEKTTKILITPPSFIHLIQTDKPIYKPGQTVKFRIVSLMTNFLPVEWLYKTVELEDPNANRIAQWLNQPVSGILDLSHPMSPEATEGIYTINAWTEDRKTISHSFEIKKYVLPKFEVNVHLPNVITIQDKNTTVKICGKYTYGKPVLGQVKASVCSVKSWRNINTCLKYNLETDTTGCAVLDIPSLIKKNRKSITVEAEIEEYGTGVVMQGNGTAVVTYVMRTIAFENVPGSYKPGLRFEGKVKVTQPNSKPAVNESVYLQNNILTTDNKGMASFSLDTSLWGKRVTLEARHTENNREYYPSAYLTVSAFYSESKSFVVLKQGSGALPCGEQAAVQAHYIIQGTELKDGQDVLDFFYMVMSRGRVVQHGRLPVTVSKEKVKSSQVKGELSIPLQQITDLAPYAQVVVYTVMSSGEIVADSRDYPIQLCFKNKVSVKFSSPQALPGGKTRISLQAHPGSLCSVRAIDQSVLLLKPEQDLSVDYVYKQLPIQKMSSYNRQVDDDADFFSEYHGYTSSNEKNDVYSVFKDIGMKIVTNSVLKNPVLRQYVYDDMLYDDNTFQESDYQHAVNEDIPSRRVETKEKKKPKEINRTYFPETWIWDLIPVGVNGSVNIEKAVPDTITKWATSTFCTSSVGFGLSPNIGLTAFQPFFVSLTLPYSVIRGEWFRLKATVFNYLTKCIMVRVTLADSLEYNSTECEGCQYSLCLCGEESSTFKWLITPTSLGEVSLKVSAEALRTDTLCGNEVATVPEDGQIDTVVRTLLVEAEGTPETVSHNAFLCPAAAPVEKDISLMLPEMVVAGSTKASISVVGDIMGRAMKNLDKLLAMPYGCGEQNMVLFAPNIYILNYLSITGQLTKEIQDKATVFLQSGYQRELNYKHNDGSYSAFGKSDPSGNTWLTSFVMKSFGSARPYIFVDPKHIADAKTWLAGRQQNNGCILSVGKLFHNDMKGGVSDDVSLTAYVTAALLELDTNTTDPIIQKSLGCLKTAAADVLDNMYTTALFAYTLSLAGDEETRSKLITYLDQRVTTEGGTRHWQRAEASSKTLGSLEIEMTAYVLLALLSGPPMPGFGFDYMISIVRWLTQQQNAFGGFSSTQDTVVALQALAKYGAATYSPEGASSVTVTSLGGFKKEFTVDQSNRLLYQEEKLTEIPGEYKIRAEGKGCLLAQIAMRYNIPPPADFSAFNISAETLDSCNATRPRSVLSVAVRYQGRREETNMVIINVKLLSGYVPDKSSLQVLKQDTSVKRVDVEEGYINIYLDELRRNDLKTYSVTIEEDVPVRNLKPAVIKVYDYYKTSDEAVTDYTTTCAESDSLNEL